MGTEWERREGGLYVPRLSSSRQDQTSPQHPDGAEPRGQSLPEQIAGWASLSAVIGAAGFVYSWAFYTTFYDHFGLTPEDVGLDFAAIGARSAFILLPWWSTILLLVAVRAGIPRTRAFLSPVAIAGLATALYSLYIGHGLSSAVKNAGTYASTPAVCGDFLLFFLAFYFLFRRDGPNHHSGLRWFSAALIVATSCIGLAYSSYGRAEMAAELVASEAFQVQVRAFPDIDVLNVTEVRVWPSATSEGPGLARYDGLGKPRGYDPKLRVAKSSILNRAIQSDKCLLFLGSANGVDHFWTPAVSLGADDGEVTSFPSDEVIASRDIDSLPDSCAPLGQTESVHIGTVTLP